jgi:hypothetical protein
MILRDTCLAHSPENMDQFWINDVAQINRRDGSELDCRGEIRIVPDRECIDLIAYKVNLVSLAKPHQRNDRVPRIAAA